MQFSWPSAAQMDRRAIEAIGQTLSGSDWALVVATGIGGLAPGRVLTEVDAAGPDAVRLSERAAFAFADRGVRCSAVRLPPTVHGEDDHGFVPALISLARNTGVSMCPGDGSNRRPAVHRLDAAPLFRIAAEQAAAGTILHAVAEQGVPVVDIADTIGRRLGVPVESVSPETSAERAGFIGAIFALDIPAASDETRQRFGWHPAQPGLLADLTQGNHYFR